MKISGSVAVYKSADLASKLVQKGFEVQVVATESALRFVGRATFEAITGKRVFTDIFENGEMMNHIRLVKWADLVILAPASANTLNKMASGIADNLVTSLFLAHDPAKPYLVVPAMNSAMLLHPATQHSIKTLKGWGIHVMDTVTGRLACGDTGPGKFPDPQDISDYIQCILPSAENSRVEKKKILITSGGTREKIDEVREIRNISTGNTGATIADVFIRKNWEVTFLHAEGSKCPVNGCQKISFTSFESLFGTLKELLGKNEYHSVIHLAAVSDYSIHSVSVKGKVMKAPLPAKLDSTAGEIIIHLTRNFKILDQMLEFSLLRKPKLVAFKFTTGSNEEEILLKLEEMMLGSGADLIIWNDAESRINGIQTRFTIYSGHNEPVEKWDEAEELALRLESIISEKLK